MEEWRRRELLIAGVGLILTSSCGGQRRVREEAPAEEPPPAEPASVPPTDPGVREPAAAGEAAPPEEAPLPPVSILERVLPRSSWTSMPVDPGRARPMKGIRRITIHHEGSGHVRTATDYASNAALIERIRAYHVEARGWADLGYHFVIDPAGRIWEGRPLAWQGAHVRDFNAHNLGVVLLGNFDRQQPSLQQLIVLPQLVQALRRQYAVPLGSLRSHQEWTPTACPGKNMQPRFEQMRSAGQFT